MYQRVLGLNLESTEGRTVEIGAVSNATYWLNPRGKSWILCFSWHPLTHPDVWLSLPRCCSPLVSQTDTHTPLSISLHHPISLSRASLGPSGLYIRPHLHPPLPSISLPLFSLQLCLLSKVSFESQLWFQCFCCCTNNKRITRTQPVTLICKQLRSLGQNFIAIFNYCRS